MQPASGRVQPAVWRGKAAGAILLRMLPKMTIVVLTVVLVVAAVAFQSPSPLANAPQYTSDSEMKLPDNYRDWTYLTTGFDMSYNPAMRMGHHMFDNVFVNPEAYKFFLQNGTWPDKTVFVLEGRMAKDKNSINKAGNYQATEVMGREIHVKDEARFPGKWAFFAGSDDGKSAKLIPQSASCYSCHADHAAVDTTFVQFYPTLLPVAEAKKTLSPGYLKDIENEKQTAARK